MTESKLNKTLFALLILLSGVLKMYPQSKAEAIAKNGCLAMAYLYCIGIEDDIELLTSVAKAMEKGLLGSDCFVNDAEKYLTWISGKRYSVTKKSIEEIVKDGGLKTLKEPTPVRYDYNGLYHWVVMQEGKIIFNSLSNSVCVKYGQVSTARIISLKQDK